jgi:hypothetical protein
MVAKIMNRKLNDGMTEQGNTKCPQPLYGVGIKIHFTPFENVCILI